MAVESKRTDAQQEGALLRSRRPYDLWVAEVGKSFDFPNKMAKAKKIGALMVNSWAVRAARRAATKDLRGRLPDLPSEIIRNFLGVEAECVCGAVGREELRELAYAARVKGRRDVVEYYSSLLRDAAARGCQRFHLKDEMVAGAPKCRDGSTVSFNFVEKFLSSRGLDYDKEGRVVSWCTAEDEYAEEENDFGFEEVVGAVVEGDSLREHFLKSTREDGAKMAAYMKGLFEERAMAGHSSITITQDIIDGIPRKQDGASYPVFDEDRVSPDAHLPLVHWIKNDTPYRMILTEEDATPPDSLPSSVPFDVRFFSEELPWPSLW